VAAFGPVLVHDLITALGWTLVHFLWQGCVLAGLFWLVCVFSGPGNAQLRYWVGIGALFLSLVSLAITFSLYYRPEARFVTEPVQSGAINPFLVLSGVWPDSRTLLQHGLEPALPVIVLLWIAGVLSQCARAVYGWAGIRSVVCLATTDIGSSLRSVIGDLQQLIGVRHPVKILKSALVKVPMTAGWLKPVILLPASVLVQLPRDQLEMIIAHELGHIRRHDHLFNLFQILMETVLFYHPAITWMSNRVRQERETCCDDLVVACCNKPATYARALANLEVLRGNANQWALAAAGGDLLGRIRRIIDHELPRARLGYVQIAFLALVTAFVGLGAQQGMLISDALNQVAGSLRLQASDVEWKTWNASRIAWASGMQNYAEKAQALQSVARAAAATAPEQPPARTSAAKSFRVQNDTAAASIADQVQVKPAAAPELEAKTTQELAFPVAQASAPVLLAAAPAPQTVRPVPLATAAPKYPWRALTKGIEGFVELAFSLDGKGNVIDIEVIDSLPGGTFERAATKALKKWKFAEAGGAGKPQRWVQKFDFALQQENKPEPIARNCAAAGHRACTRIPANAVVVYVNPPRETESLSRVN
jgi:TonB family protein